MPPALPGALGLPRARFALLGLTASRAISSAGRAPPRQGGGHWFEPSIAHLRNPRFCGGSVIFGRRCGLNLGLNFQLPRRLIQELPEPAHGGFTGVAGCRSLAWPLRLDPVRQSFQEPARIPLRVALLPLAA